MSQKHYMHLTYDNRLTIHSLLNENKSFREIGRIISKSASTISREIKNNRYTKKQYYSSDYRCKHYLNCVNRFNKCYDTCSLYELETCSRLIKAPWVCIGCTKYNICKKSKVIYDPKKAQLKYEKTLSSSRIGPHCSKEALNYLDEILSKYLKERKQPLSHIVAHTDIGVGTSTVYRYIDNGYLPNVKNIDLPRKVRYKKRHKQNNDNNGKTKKNNHQKIRFNRTYLDFLTFIKSHPKASIVEMDTVEGTRGGSCLLVILFRKSNFMIAFKRNLNDVHSVIDCFDFIKSKLKLTEFLNLFRVILTDRGFEFSKPDLIESIPGHRLRVNLFYCDPRQAQQKPKVEKNNDYIRYFIPKGTSMDNLSQKDVVNMMCNINSVKRPSLGNKSPFECLTNYQKRVLKKLGYNEVSPDKVILSSSVFNK